MTEREALLGIAVVGILGLPWLVFRVAGPSRSKDAALENDEALDKYGWGDAIPGGRAFRESGHAAGRSRDDSESHHDSGPSSDGADDGDD